MMSPMKLPNGRRAAHEGAGPTKPPVSFWPWTLAAATAVVVVAIAVTMWLLTIASGAKPGTDQANSRLDAVRTGLAAGAGVGAAVGLMLAFRRQHHQEIATDLTDRDATERRITELYTKAVEQLGSDKAPVRLGGLYALERLAQDTPEHRQTIVNVICAYLRMPFSPTPPASKPQPEATEDQGEPAPETETRSDGIGATWQQERQVRLTAQRILAEHLRDDRADDKRSTEPPSPRFWPEIHLDLTGATLIDFDLVGAVLADARFSLATFNRFAMFTGATFNGLAMFDGATFNGLARFDYATFNGSAVFMGAIFSGAARFVEATLNRGALFDSATFTADAVFHGATFNDRARFDEATFSGGAAFHKATFSGSVVFSKATFRSSAGFRGAIFNDVAGFVGATFGDRAGFDDATFSGEAMFDEATFSGGEGSLSFKQSRVLPSDARHVWPTGWRLGPDGSGGYTVIRAKDDGRS